MRTKTLLTTAALSVAGLLSASAQVYSVNAVGYVNTEIPVGYAIIANPLVGANNTVSNLFPTAPDGTTLYIFNNGTYTGNVLDFGAWSNPNQVLLPGQGFFIFNGGVKWTNTFVGEVMQGAMTNAIPVGYSLKSSQVPQQGKLQTDLQFPVQDGDTVYVYTNNGSGGGSYTGYAYDFGSWSAEPTVNVGQGFFVFRGAAGPSWIRNFNVNN